MDHGFAHLLLGEIVGGLHYRVIQEGQQFVAEITQPLRSRTCSIHSASIAPRVSAKLLRQEEAFTTSEAEGLLREVGA